MQWLNAQQPNIFECRAFSPFKTVSVISPLQFCFFNVYPEFIYRNFPGSFCGVIKACICCGAIYDLENLFIDQYTQF